MKKCLCVLLLAFLLYSVSAYGNDRYEYCLTTFDGEKYYIDTQSITTTKDPDIVRFWVKVSISDKARKLRVSQAKTKRQRERLSRYAEMKRCEEINFRENIYRILQVDAYDAKGRVIDSSKSQEWNHIPPDSIAEALRNDVRNIIQSRTNNSVQQPFIVLSIPERVETPKLRIVEEPDDLDTALSPEQEEALRKAVLEYSDIFSHNPDGENESFSVLRVIEPIQVREYIVVQGDSMWSISNKFNIETETIRGSNDFKMLKPGARLRIPNQNGIFYTLKSGEKVEEVAERYHVSMTDIVYVNEVKNIASLKAGDEIFLPGAIPMP